MFVNLLHLLTGNSPSKPDYDQAFVRDINVRAVEPRSRLVEQRLIVGWLLIVLKCFLVGWAITHYRVPINAWWIILPTVGMGLACTMLYWKRG